MPKRRVLHKPGAPKTKANGHLPKDKGFWSHGTVLKILICFFLILTTVVIFWPLGNCEFINLDDHAYVSANPQVKAGLTLKGMVWALTTMHMGNWHPLTWLSHMLDCELYGLRAGGHHWTNVLWHIASTLLLFLVLERMTGGVWRSGFVAALFALHPLHVESMAWVAERKDVLSTFFWMLTLWAYVHYTERSGRNRYLMVLCFFALGLLSKAMLVTLPCVMLLLDYWPLRRFQFGQPSTQGYSKPDKSMNRNDQRSSSHRLVLEKIPFFALAAGSSLVTFLAQKGGGAVGSFEWLPLEARLGNALVSYVSYIGKMIWPSSLAIFYPHPGMLPMWQVVGALLLLVGISVWVVRAAHKYPYLGVGWLWYLGTLVPVIGLVQVGVQGMADRYTYIPLIGLFIMMAWGVPDILGGWRYRKTVLAVSAGVSLCILMAVTRHQIYLWHDSITLFTYTLNVTTRNYVTHNSLGNALADQARKQEAIAHYNQALRINPQYADAHYNLANALASQQKKEEAIAHYNQALRINPQYAEAYNNLGNALASQEKKEEAIAHYNQALRINPQYAEAYYNLGAALADLGRKQEAIAHYNQALRINPQYAEAHNNLGNALSSQGKKEEAIAHCTEALRIKPDFAEAHNNLGAALADQGKKEEAITHYANAVRINPDFAEAHINLGDSLTEQGRFEEAILHFAKALRINPNFAEAHFSLGLAYFMTGNRNKALEEYKILKTINPDLAKTLSQKISK